MIRPDWTNEEEKHRAQISNARLDLSRNICVDRYLDFKIDPYNFTDADVCYKTLADYHGVSPYNIAIGFGISELMTRVFQWLKYNNMSIVFKMTNSWAAMEGYRAAYDIPIGNKVLYLATPSGMTGEAISREEYLMLCDAYPLVLLDEAYNDFSDIIYPPRPNVIKFKTMSKSLAMTGARFGWCVGDKEIIQFLQNVRPGHYTVGGMEQLPEMLKEIPFHVERMMETKEYLKENFDVTGNYGNYVRFKDQSFMDPYIATRNGRMALCDLETFHEHYRPH